MARMGGTISNDAEVDERTSVDDLVDAAMDAVTSDDRPTGQEQAPPADRSRRRRRRPSLLARAVDSLPYLGPLLVALATSIWLYDLLLLVRLLVLDG